MTLLLREEKKEKESMKTTWKANSGNHQSAGRLTQPPVHVLRTYTVTGSMMLSPYSMPLLILKLV